MNLDKKEITLLTKEQVYRDNKIEVIEKFGVKCAVTDFAIVLGAYVNDDHHVFYDNSLKGRIGWHYLSSSDGTGDVCIVGINGNEAWIYADERTGGVRPVIPFFPISTISSNGVKGSNGFLEVEYGEYPQYVVSTFMEEELNHAYNLGLLKTTGKLYTTDSTRCSNNSSPFEAIEHEEYEYNGKKYIRIQDINGNGEILSNDKRYAIGDYIWIEVSP